MRLGLDLLRDGLADRNYNSVHWFRCHLGGESGSLLEHDPALGNDNIVSPQWYEAEGIHLTRALWTISVGVQWMALAGSSYRVACLLNKY